MSWLSRWFGYCGKVRFEGETVDGREIEGTIKIESFNCSKGKMEEEIKNIFYVEKGMRLKTLRITAFTESRG